MKSLKIEVKEVIEHCGAKHKKGDSFFIKGKGMIEIPGNNGFCIYAIASLMPFLTAKQREDEFSDDDWVPKTTELCCPDPNGVIFKISSLD